MVPMLTCGLVRSNLAFATVDPFPLWKCAGSSVPDLLWTLLGNSRRAVVLLAGGLGDDSLGHVLRNLGVAVEDHGVAGAPLGLGAQVTDVAEHLRQRDERLDHASAAAL